MSYKIAVGSSDKINVNLKFGEATSFLIYEVSDEIKLIEERKVSDSETSSLNNLSGCTSHGCASQGCGTGQGGCHGFTDSKVDLIADCRCVVCTKIGFQAQKAFEKKAISVFDVDCEISEALQKISSYYTKIDNHKSFRKEPN